MKGGDIMEPVEFYIADLMRVISDIVNSAKGEKPDWKRLELKGEDLKVLARAAKGWKARGKSGMIEELPLGGMRQPLGPLRPSGASGRQTRKVVLTSKYVCPFCPGTSCATRGPVGYLLAMNTGPGWT
ncbi:hypothetical protein ES703_50647 [subsurface metagenome]